VDMNAAVCRRSASPGYLWYGPDFSKPIIMPNKANAQPPRFVGPCPNPNCSSRPCIFKNVQKHITQKHECTEFMMAYRKSLLTKSLSSETQMEVSPFLDSSLVCHPTNTSTNNPAFALDALDNWFPINNDSPFDNEPDEEHPMFVHHPMDFEQTNFDQFFASDIAQQYLVSP
jgi:hypothetical protein